MQDNVWSAHAVGGESATLKLVDLIALWMGDGYVEQFLELFQTTSRNLAYSHPVDSMVRVTTT